MYRINNVIKFLFNKKLFIKINLLFLVKLNI